SNFRAQGSLGDALLEDKVVGIHSVDTRAVARLVRGQDSAFAGIFSGDDLKNTSVDERVLAVQRSAKEAFKIDLVTVVTTTEVRKVEAKNETRAHFAVLDFGLKNS